MATYVPPRDAYELQVAVAAGEALARNDIGVFDDVIDLGLNRQEARGLIARIRTLVGREISLDEVWQSRTVASLASLCRARERRGRWSSLVTMRHGSSAVPLVFVHPLGGNAFWYLNLCRTLDDEQGVFGLHSRGLDLTEKPQTEISEMARSYVADLRAEIPHGPYVLAGWSFGGLVAFEMCRELSTLCEHVPLVVMFDIGPDNCVDAGTTTVEAARLLIHALRLDRLAEEIMALPEVARTAEMLRHAQRRAIVPSDFTVADLDRMLQLNVLHLSAMHRYAFGRSAADILLFQAAGNTVPGPSSGLGWGRFTTGQVFIHLLPGTHFDSLNRANHGAIAARLLSELTRVTHASG